MNNSTRLGADGDIGGEKAYQKSLEFAFEVVLMSVIGVLGLAGNVAAIWLFSHQSRQLKFHRLMTMLAIYDLLYIALSLTLFTLPQISADYKLSGAHFFVLPRALPLAQMALTGSIYSTLAITIERYLIVCHPFYTVSHRWSARRYIIPIVVFSLVYNVPKFFELETGVRDEDAEHDSPYLYTIDPTPMRVHPLYIKIYCIWMNFVFMGLIPFCLLVVLNLLTLRSLIVQKNHHKSSTDCHVASEWACSSKRNEIALAKVSLTIVFVFILCHSVKWVPNLFELARLAREKNKQRDWPAWVESTTHVSHFLMTFNSAVNFYIYCVKHFNLLSKVCGRGGGGASTDTEVMTMTANHNGRHASEPLLLNPDRHSVRMASVSSNVL